MSALAWTAVVLGVLALAGMVAHVVGTVERDDDDGPMDGGAW